MPKISICIPVYNVETLIERCLDSVQNQTLSDIEIIVVDDCSPDNSMKFVERRAMIDCRIKILRHERNRGLMVARRTAYKEAKGDYIMFCDSDDFLPIDSVEKLYNSITESDADVVSSDLCYIDIYNKKHLKKSFLQYGNDKISVLKSLLKGDYMHNIWAKIYKRELLQNNQYNTYDNLINGEDACLFYQIVDNCNNIIHICESTYNYCQNTSSSTNKKLSRKAIDNILLTNKTIIDVCSKYHEIIKLCKRRTFLSLAFFINIGYEKEISDSAKQYGLDYYLNRSNAFEYLNICEYLEYICKRFYYSCKNKIR